MTFLDKLDFLMNKYSLNKNTLSQVSGVPYTTIDSFYKKGYENAKLSTIQKLADYFNTTLDYLMRDEINDPNYGKSSGFEVGYEEMEHIKKYRSLDPIGQEAVNFILDRECNHIKQLNQVIHRQTASLRIYTYMHKIACAGSGFYFEDIPTDTIEAPLMEGADFIIGVSGDSMEPTFYDGDKVYVEKRQIVETGDIGIFIYNNEFLIKEAGKDGLISHNQAENKYPIIPGTENIQCIGKVLGKVQGDEGDKSDKTFEHRLVLKNFEKALAADALAEKSDKLG